jgi:hypothetical protein
MSRGMVRPAWLFRIVVSRVRCHHTLWDDLSRFGRHVRREVVQYTVRTAPDSRPTATPPPLSPVSSSSGTSSGAPAAPPADTRVQRAPSFRRPPSSRRGEALWRLGAGGGRSGSQQLDIGSQGAASSESRRGEWSAPGLRQVRLLSRPRIRSRARSSAVWVRWWVGMEL